MATPPRQRVPSRESGMLTDPLNVIAPIVGLLIAVVIILGPGAPTFDLTSALRGVALFVVINWLLVPTVARLWRMVDDRTR